MDVLNVDTTECLSLIILTLSIVILVEIWLKNRGLPPGPWGYPLLGYYPHISNKPHEQFAELSKKYGDVMSLRSIGGTLFIIVNGMKLSKEVMLSDEFTGRPLDLIIFSLLIPGDSILNSEGSVWKEQKRFFMSAAKDYGYGKIEYEGFMHEMVRKFIQDLRDYENKSLDWSVDIANLTCNIMAEIVCKKRFPKNDRTFKALNNGFAEIGTTFASLGRIVAGPYLKLRMSPLTSAGRKVRKITQTFRDIGKELVQEHVRTFNPHHLRDVIDSTLSHIKSLEEKGVLKNTSFTMKNLEQNTLNALLEGTETVGTMINSLLLLLTLHVDVQKKAQREIDEVVDRDRLPSWRDKKNLPYFDSVLMELCRLAMPFNISTYYSNYKETTIRGYRIPKRSILLTNFWSMHHDPILFPEPEKFNPDRYLGTEGQKLKVDGPVPFGIGKRSCPGEPLAQMEVFIIMASIIQNFTIYPGKKEGEILAEARNM